MANNEKNYLTSDRYNEKRYEVTRDILVGLVGTVDLETIKHEKQRETMVFYSLQLADSLLKGLNYCRSQVNSGQTINSLADLMKATDDDDSESSE